MTQPAQICEHTSTHEGRADSTEAPNVEPRHSFIRAAAQEQQERTGTTGAAGAESVPPFLVRDGADGQVPLVLPRLLAWAGLGLLAYIALQAGNSTYHLVRDPRVTPLAASEVLTALHSVRSAHGGLLDGMRLDAAHALTRSAGPSASSASPTSDLSDHEVAAALAFVPHSHVPHIKVNATVYECRLWSMFACEPVGRVIELLPGEVEVEVKEAATPTNRARGQYALMQLTDPHAAQAESLRVREPQEGNQGPALSDDDSTATLL